MLAAMLMFLILSRSIESFNLCKVEASLFCDPLDSFSKELLYSSDILMQISDQVFLGCFELIFEYFEIIY